MLAQDVCAELTSRGIEYDAPDRDRLDICSPAEIAAFLDEMEPEAVVNCAAYTAVDAAEENEGVASRLMRLLRNTWRKRPQSAASLWCRSQRTMSSRGRPRPLTRRMRHFTRWALTGGPKPAANGRCGQTTRRRTLSARRGCTVRAGRASRRRWRVCSRRMARRMWLTISMGNQHGPLTSPESWLTW